MLLTFLKNNIGIVFYRVARVIWWTGILLGSLIAVLLIRLSYGPLSLDFAKSYFTKVLRPYGLEEGKIFLSWPVKDTFSLILTNIKSSSLRANSIELKATLSSIFTGQYPAYEIDCTDLWINLHSDQSKNFQFQLSEVQKWLSFLSKTRVNIREATLIMPILGHSVTYKELSLITQEKEGSMYYGSQKVIGVRWDGDKFFVDLQKLPLSIQGLKVFDIPAEGNFVLEGQVQAEIKSSTQWHITADLHQQASTFVYLQDKDRKVPLSDIQVKAQSDPQKTVLSRALANIDGAIIDVQGIITQKSHSQEVNLETELSSGALSVKSLPLLWPASVGESAREWILTNFRDGKIHLLKAEMVMILPEKGEMRFPKFQGKLGIRDVTLSFMEEMPFITDLEAVSDITLDGFSIQVISGLFHNHMLQKGTIAIRPLAGLPYLDLNLDLKGPFGSLVEIIAKFSSLKDMPLTHIIGIDETKIVTRFPLLANLKKEEVNLNLTSYVKNGGFDIKVLGKPLQVRKSSLEIRGNHEAMVIKGISQVNHIPTKWTWKGGEEISFSARPSSAQVKGLINIDLSPYISEAFDLEGEHTTKATTIKINLAKNDCHLPWVQWKKPKGVPLTINLSQTQSKGSKSKGAFYTIVARGALEGKAKIETVRDQLASVEAQCRTDQDWMRYVYRDHHHRLFFQGKVLQLGSTRNEEAPVVWKTNLPPSQAILTPPRGIPPSPPIHPFLPSCRGGPHLIPSSFPQPKASYNPSPQVRSIKTANPTTFQTLFKGSSRPLKSLPKPSKKISCQETILAKSSQNKIHPKSSLPGSEQISLDLDCEQLILKDVTLFQCHATLQGHSINPLKPWSQFSNLKWDYGSAFATVLRKNSKEKGHVLLNLSPKANGDVIIQIDVTDAGALLSGLGLTDDVRAGKLYLLAKQDFKGGYTGLAQMESLLTKAPFLGKLLAMISPMLFTEFFSPGLLFHQVSVYFHYYQGKLILDQGVGQGTNLGLSLRGTIDCVTQTGKLGGAIVPSYFLNTFFRYVPILGWLLGGEKGLVSTEFTMKGDLKDPKIRIQPLSILKLGFIKDLFRDPLEEEVILEKDFFSP